MDISGETQRDISHNILKTRVEPSGKFVRGSRTTDLKNDVEKHQESQDPNYCGSCYGGKAPNESGCCNTCEEVRTAYTNKGWSFTNPDRIEQVGVFVFVFNIECLLCHTLPSAITKAGLIS